MSTIANTDPADAPSTEPTTESLAADIARLTRALEHERRERANAVKDRDAVRAKLAELEAQPPAQPPAQPQDDVRKLLEAERKAWTERLTALEGSIKAEQDKRTQAERRLAEERTLEKIRRAALPFVHEDALDDVINRVRPAIRYGEDGQESLYDGDLPLLSSKTPGAPMPIEEFLQDRVLKSARHLLKPTTGAGTNGSGGSGASPAGVLTLTRAQAKNLSVYQRVMEQAAKTGQEVQIEG